ncbi:hypothetical protein BDN71DRAFT_1444288 [Pleurotus eryngii]|uniref:Uncharacterized protein n=1 Tax=Pleurotus eryngii TaxID=5323 RepID=A0A9P6D992_PLEER|nr:hypothetical protein BDN71DRAFT_1444288 [Pleurotus eryngii]
MATVTQLAKYNQGERAVLKLWKPGYLAAKTTSERKAAFAVAAAELFNYWITQMKTDAEKKKGFSPEEKKQREGELLVWVRNNWQAKRHCKKVTEDGGQLLRIGYRTVLPRMDAYKERIEEYANQYLEAAVLGELEKAKSAYAEGRSVTENIGEMAQEEEPDWVEVEARIRTAATKRNSLGYRSMAMRQIYFAMEPLECDAVKEEIAKLQAERNSEPALDANCRNMFKRFGMLTYSIAVFLDPEGNPKFTSADAGRLIFKDNLIKDKRLEDQVWYHFTQQVVALNKKRFGKADDPTAVDNDIPVDALDSQIQLSKNANGTPILPSRFVANVPVHSKIVKQTLNWRLTLMLPIVLASGRHDTKVPWTVLSQHCEEAVAADYLPTAPMFKFGQPHNMVAELANEWAYYNTKEKQMMPARYSADRLVRTRLVKATKIITSNQSMTVVNSSSPAQPSTGDRSVCAGSEVSDMLPNVPPPGRARLSHTFRNVIISDNGTRSGSPAPSIPMQRESPPPTPVSPPRKIKKGGKTKPGRKRLKGARADVSASLTSELIAIRPKPRRLQLPATEETNDPEPQYPPVHSNTAGPVTDQSEARAINTAQHTNTLTTKPSATARKRVTEEERLAHDAERYRAAEGSKRQPKKSSRALNQ